MYTGELQKEDATIKELKLLAAADKYEVVELTRFLDSRLCTCFTDDTAFEFWKAANLHNAPMLKETSASYLLSGANREAAVKVLKSMILADDVCERAMAAELLEERNGLEGFH
ncbi:unnamed protein product [Closterium sp. NIES-64]|nr:unnamed protein product [Closterium sp. NIES-64]